MSTATTPIFEPLAPAIRPLAPEDLPEVVRLCGEHAAFEKASFDPSGKEEAFSRLFFAHPPRAFCWVAAREASPGGRLLGYASASREVSTWAAVEFLHMDCLFLSANARGSGLGRALLSQVAAFAESSGCLEVQWQTPDWNLDAARFYHRNGAKSLPKLRFFLPPGELPPD